jgi:hypothetical protein
MPWMRTASPSANIRHLPKHCIQPSTPEKHFVSCRAYSSQFHWPHSQILKKPLPRSRRSSRNQMLAAVRFEPPTKGSGCGSRYRSGDGRRSPSYSMWLCLRSPRHRDWCWPAVVRVLLSMFLVEGATVNSPSHLRFQSHFTAPRANGVGLSFYAACS